MESSLSRNLLCATVVVASFTACGGSGGAPIAPSSLGAAQNRFHQQVRIIALSGEYRGKFHDSVGGTTRLRLYLSQTQSTLGGALVSARGSQGLAGVVAWVANGRSISGNAVSRSQSGFCTFSVSGRYKYRRLNGSYTATYGCSGQTGTFTLWHKCYVPTTGSEAIRPEGAVKPC